ncbi:MAG: glycosyl hydrolase, family 5, partial [Acidobacteriaceae bacterium]|nr:glycosyl hydrolase, family 5 [Acidobacteriaceae bacterium]
PYKKMEKSSAIVSFQKPEHWDEIVAYGKKRRGVGNTEKQLALRPSPQTAADALHQLLDNVQLANCRVNTGYIEALGLKVPGAAHAAK